MFQTIAAIVTLVILGILALSLVAGVVVVIVFPWETIMNFLYSDFYGFKVLDVIFLPLIALAFIGGGLFGTLRR